MHVLKESQDGFLEFHKTFKHFRLLLDLHFFCSKAALPISAAVCGLPLPQDD